MQNVILVLFQQDQDSNPYAVPLFDFFSGLGSIDEEIRQRCTGQMALALHHLKVKDADAKIVEKAIFNLSKVELSLK